MEKSRGAIADFISSNKRKLLALATGLGIAAGTMIDQDAQPAKAATVEAVPEKPLSPHEARMEALRKLDEGRTIETKEQIDARFAVIDPLTNLAYYRDNSKTMIIQVDRYLGVLLFDPLTEKDAEYKKMSLAEVGDCLRDTIERGKTQKIRDEARRILKGRLHEELIETIGHMSPEEVVARRVFLGLDVHSGHKTSTKDIAGAWKRKMDTASSTSEEVREYAPSTILQLEGKEGSVTLSLWMEKQKEALDLLAAHADELGYSPELIRLITPEVILGVIGAETCASLSPETFVRVSPVLFEAMNIAFLPAGDKHYSGGAVQITADTIKRITDKHRKALERIRSTESNVGFIVASEDDAEEISASITDVETQFLLNAIVLAENLRLAMRKINTDPRFVSAWSSGSEEDRALYVGTLIPMANNLPSSAKRAAEAALDENPKSLAEMTKRLSSHTTVETVRRNGTVGLETMKYLLLLGQRR